MVDLPIIKKVDQCLNEQLLNDFKGQRSGFVQIGPDEFFLPVKYESIAKELLEFEVRSDDTWLITFPRSGTTVCQELIWMLLNNLDTETAAKIKLPIRFPFLEFNVIFDDEFVAEIKDSISDTPEILQNFNAFTKPAWKTLETAPSPRLIKTHLPFQLLPKDLLSCGAKVIYMARNPKDTAVSWYHMNKLVKHLDYVGDFTKFWDYFERGLVCWSPYWPHVTEAWNKRRDNNFHFVFFEEFIKNPAEFIKKMSTFLNKSVTDVEVSKLVEHLKFDNFKNNPSVNMTSSNALNLRNENAQPYIRKGKVGGWVEEFTPELSARADKWIEENLKETDLKFHF